MSRMSFILAGPVIAIFLGLLDAPFGLSPQAWALVGLASWMILWWMTEATPVAITALLPIAMMPMMGIAPQKIVSASYGHPLIFLFLGGFLIAAAMQRWGLHRRIALSIVSRVGSSGSAIVGGFMGATALLSMWISNTATALMMFTVGASLIEFVGTKVDDPAQVRRFGVCLMLGIAYSASIGGVATLIGTPPNTLLASYLSDNYQIEIDFARWMMVGVPLVVVMLPLTWYLLCKRLFPIGELAFSEAADLVNRELKQMGAMSQGEKIVLWVFLATAIAWVTRKWLVLMTGLPITDTSIALIAAGILFVIPTSLEQDEFAVDWSAARKVPWEILILFGGGLALASGFKSTGLAAAIGDGVASLSHLDIGLIILATTLSIIFLTEVTSNTATTAAFLPIMGAVSVGIGYSPMVLVIPVALAASMAFMMPVATPPNAIVFSYKELKVKDMMRAGIWLNMITVGLIYTVMMSIVPWVFGLTL